MGLSEIKFGGETRGGQEEEQSIDQYETQTRGADIDIAAGVERVFSNWDLICVITLFFIILTIGAIVFLLHRQMIF